MHPACRWSLWAAALGSALSARGAAGFGDVEHLAWPFTRPLPSPVPSASQLRHGDRVANPIDAFLLEQLERLGIAPAPKADKFTLVRRAHVDLLGLPPAPEEVEAFVNDASDDAWSKLVDRLLASPHYGERWGRHWLDVAG